MTEPTAASEVELDLIVASRSIIADRVVEIILCAPGGAALPVWAPGAHVDLLLGPGLIRQYSLCGDPADRHRWRLAVLRQPDSRGGSVRAHALRPGQSVRARGPRNHFRLHDAPRYLFIAGGVGITPILPMIRAADLAGADWQLLYGGRSRSSMAFRDELTGDRVRLRPADEFGLLDLARLLDEPAADTPVYCCGPEPLLTAVESRCAGWPVGSLHIERFGALPTDSAAPQAQFAVECAASGITLTVAAGQSILAAAADAGIATVSSCAEGICGTCETAVLAGTPEHRDSVLSQQERDDGEVMMIRVSRARTPRLALDL